MKIDAHIHYTPPTMGSNLAELSEQDPYWGLLATPSPFNPSIQGWASFERTIDDMDKAGLDKVVVLGVYSQTLENSIKTNNDTLDFIRKYSDRVIGFAVIYPKPLNKALDELKRCLDGGIMGVGELGLYGMGLSFDDLDFLKIIETCIDLDLPVNLHVNDDIGHFYLGKAPYSLGNCYQLACRFPELKLILAHWGGGLFLNEIMPEVQKDLKNVYYDTSGTDIYPTKPIFKAALQCISHKKLLHGSDYPLITCPSKQKEPDFRSYIEEIGELNLSDEIYSDILGNNAARLFGLLEPEKEARDLDVISETPTAVLPIITDVDRMQDFKVEEQMAVSAVAQAYPETRHIFEKYNIPWKDSPVPFWEPIMQSAAARGIGTKCRRRLLEELNRAIKT